MSFVFFELFFFINVEFLNFIFYGNFARNFGICLFFSLCEAAVKLDEDLIATEIERSNTTSAPELRLQT